MCDTDSIIYIYDPTQYNVPEGSMLGDWEEEDCSVTGIEEFVGWGPKTYALKLADGSEIVKVSHKNVDPIFSLQLQLDK
jgi:hypothetical protein